ncbi:MAG: hypothetical protein ACPGU7_12395 [Gammaproteobacteria bacterium]
MSKPANRTQSERLHRDARMKEIPPMDEASRKAATRRSPWTTFYREISKSDESPETLRDIAFLGYN